MVRPCQGSIHEYGIAPEEFLHFVHDIDRSSLGAQSALARAIEALPGRKLILTNGSHAHALATAKQLGIDHLFEDVFGIEAADYLPKPALQTFYALFRAARGRSLARGDVRGYRP